MPGSCTSATCGTAPFLNQIFEENQVDGVINFAAYSLVGESVTNPLKYYGNNVAGSQSMLTP